jgi:hypothetical protein
MVKRVKMVEMVLDKRSVASWLLRFLVGMVMTGSLLQNLAASTPLPFHGLTRPISACLRW